MQLSSVDLNDPKTVRYDDRGRSPAYFCLGDPVRVDTVLVAELKKAAARLGGSNIRLCLHDSPDSTFHEMINLEHRGKYYRPHKHLKKGESWHIIEGSMAAFVFDEEGRVTDANVLEPDGNFLFRVGVNMYHAVMPLSEVVIYHESKPGPFLPEGENVFPPWAPNGNNPDEAEAYSSELRRSLGSS